MLSQFLRRLSQAIRELKYTYLVEGLVFIMMASLVLPRAGISGMLVCSLICTLLFTYANGVWRVAKLARENQQPRLLRWHDPLARYLLFLLPGGLATEWLLRDTPAWFHLVGCATLIGRAGSGGHSDLRCRKT